MGRILLVVVAAFGLSAASAQAGWFGGGGGKLPKAIDSPILRPKVKLSHKVAPHVRHESGKYSSPSWGGDWKRLLKQRSRPLKPYLR
jgi:hypothetical protein